MSTRCAVAVAVSVCLVSTMACKSDTLVGPTPSKYIVSGVISEALPNGPMPLAGVVLDVTACIQDKTNAPSQTSLSTQTDAAGAYRVADVCAGVAYIWVYKPGYTTGRPGVGCDGECFKLTVDGDTHLDIELVRQ